MKYKDVFFPTKKQNTHVQLYFIRILALARQYCSCLIFSLLTILFSFLNSAVMAQTYSSNLFNDRSAVIDNMWLPLKPGTQYIYEGTTRENGAKISHKIVSNVTDLTKELNHIKTVVVYEQDYSENKVVEEELVFFAQDNNGNIWHFGQYSEVYDDGELVGGRAWLAGYLEGARAGIMMQANPKPDTQSYAQGYAPPPFYWTDRARVVKTGLTRKVKSGTYKNVLLIEEFSDSEPNAIQLKYYAPHVGNIEVGWKGKDKLKEALQLVKIVNLSPDELAKVRKAALSLEKRAYGYCNTQPAEMRHQSSTH